MNILTLRNVECEYEDARLMPNRGRGAASAMVRCGSKNDELFVSQSDEGIDGDGAPCP